MTTTVITTQRGAGYVRRVLSALRLAIRGRQLLNLLLGFESAVVQGKVYCIRAANLGKARHLVPAVVRCSRRFQAMQIDDELYDDLITVLSLGLSTTRADIESFDVPLWELALLVEQIARVNGLVEREGAGRSEAGKRMASLMRSIGTGSMPGSFQPPAGPGPTSTIH